MQDQNQPVSFESAIANALRFLSQFLHALLQLLQLIGGIRNALPVSTTQPAQGVPSVKTGQLQWPIKGDRVITQGFGMTDFAQSGAYGGQPHTGIDLGVPEGTPVYASQSGVVETAGMAGGYGNLVTIKSGNVETLYGHLSKILVSPGQTVTAGQLIAYSGNTGYSTGPHLHFEVRVNGVPVNPLPLLGGSGMGGAIGVDRATPYRNREVDVIGAYADWVPVYIGGRNNGGREWTPDDVHLLRNHGVVVDGIYVGENLCDGCATPDWSRGVSDAHDAFVRAQAFDVGRVFLDIEAGTWQNGGDGVRSYIRDFIRTLAQTTIAPGLYGPPECVSWARSIWPDLPVWIASWIYTVPNQQPYPGFCAWQWTNQQVLGSDGSVVWGLTWRDGVTGCEIGGGFLEYWRYLVRSLGYIDALMVIGRPLTNEMQWHGLTVQWFERARFEWHPGKRPDRWDVLLGRLGAELLGV